MTRNKLFLIGILEFTLIFGLFYGMVFYRGEYLILHEANKQLGLLVKACNHEAKRIKLSYETEKMLKKELYCD